MTLTRDAVRPNDLLKVIIVKGTASDDRRCSKRKHVVLLTNLDKTGGTFLHKLGLVLRDAPVLEPSPS